MVRFSIIIPNYNGIHYLPRCLDSITGQEYTDYEIIVVDNVSSDGSVDFVRSNYPQVRIVENTRNRGYAGGGNDGIRIGRGDWVLMLNSDTVLSSSCLLELHRSTELYPSCGMFAPKIVYPDGRINAAGSEASVSGSSWERGKGKPDSQVYNVPCEVFGPYGAAALFRRDLLEVTGGFDEDFFLFVEETDLTFRARLAGYSCTYVPRAIITHYHGATAGRKSDTALYFLHRNTLWYVIKDYPFSLLFFAFPWYLGRNLLSVLYYTGKGRGDVVVRAKMDAVRGMPAMIRKRKRVFRKRGRIQYYLTLTQPVSKEITGNSPYCQNHDSH
jgi:GT2 family glycosyltransferase